MITRHHDWPYLELLIEEAHGGDPCSDDSQEGCSNDGHGPLYAAQAQQQRLSDPAGACIITNNTNYKAFQLIVSQVPTRRAQVLVLRLYHHHSTPKHDQQAPPS